MGMSAEDMASWQRQNATKPGVPGSPEWLLRGFPDEASYNAVYGRPNTGPTAAAGPTAPTTAPAAPTPTGPDAFGQYLRNNAGAGDAWAYLSSLLEEYGLGSLNSFIQDQIIEGRSQNEVVQRLRETDTYKTRFAVIEQRKSRGLPAVSESEVVAYERQATQLMRAAGLPEGFWDSPEDFTRLQVADVSVSELNARINDGYVAAMQAPAEDRAQLESLYGVGMGALAAYYLDPDRTQAVLQRQFAAAQASAAGVRSGYGGLNREQSERMAAMGVTGTGTQAGFAQLVQERQLFNRLPGELGDEFNRDQQLAATFGGDATTQQRIQRRAEERAAAFQGGGQFATSREGYTGLGTAR